MEQNDIKTLLNPDYIKVDNGFNALKNNKIYKI